MAEPLIKFSATYTTVPAHFVDNLKHMDAALDKALPKFFERVKNAGVKAAQAKIRPHTYTGMLARSVRNDSKSSKEGAAVGTNLSYAPLQDGDNKYGLGSTGWPNVTNLRSWVQKKMRPTSDTELSSITYLVGRSIAKRGRVKNPIHFMEAARRAMMDESQRAAVKNLKVDIYKAIGK